MLVCASMPEFLFHPFPQQSSYFASPAPLSLKRYFCLYDTCPPFFFIFLPPLRNLTFPDLFTVTDLF